MNVRVMTDSGSGLSEKQAQALGIDYLPLQVSAGETTYLDGVDLTTDLLYDMLEKGDMPSTSLPPLGIVEDFAEKYEEEGVTDVVLITLSSGLSSTNSTVTAALQSHGLKVHTLDLYTTLAVEWYAANAAAQLAAADVAPEEIIRRLQEAIDDSKGFLIPEDLDHLAKGGRLTPMAAKLGGLLKIRPILEVSKDTAGKVDVWDKVRTTNKAIKKAAEHIQESLTPGKEYEFFVMDSRNPDGAALAVKSLEEAGASRVLEHALYAVIASHTGMNAVGLQYIPKVEGVAI